MMIEYSQKIEKNIFTAEKKFSGIRDISPYTGALLFGNQLEGVLTTSQFDLETLTY